MDEGPRTAKDGLMTTDDGRPTADDRHGGIMTQPRQGQHAGKRSQPGRRWILGAAAPGWFRRVWRQRIRHVPGLTQVEMNRIRRIAYL